MKNVRKLLNCNNLKQKRSIDGSTYSHALIKINDNVDCRPEIFG